jgi:putative peptide zinc metalloprotease protein
MRPLARHLTALVALVLACALPLGGAQAADPRKENIAAATTEQDGSRVFDFAWEVRKQRGGTVDHLNSARAAARCTRCGATAIAFQIVIASRPDGAVGPINEAVALNHGCTECLTIAEARQFVRVVDAPVRLTGSGRAQLGAVREALEAIPSQNLDAAQLHAAVEEQEARVEAILARELVLRGDPDTEADVIEEREFQAADVG